MYDNGKMSDILYNFYSFVTLLAYMLKKLGELPVSHREIWRIAVPIMLGNMAQTVITFTDTAFLGHLGTVELSASMMAGLYYFVYTTIAMGFAVGIQIFSHFVSRMLNQIIV